MIPASLSAHVSVDGPRLRGTIAKERLRASGTTLMRLGPGSLEDWPANDYRELAAADEIDHLGAADKLKFAIMRPTPNWNQ